MKKSQVSECARHVPGAAVMLGNGGRGSRTFWSPPAFLGVPAAVCVSAQSPSASAPADSA